MNDGHLMRFGKGVAFYTCAGGVTVDQPPAGEYVSPNAAAICVTHQNSDAVHFMGATRVRALSTGPLVHTRPSSSRVTKTGCLTGAVTADILFNTLTTKW